MVCRSWPICQFEVLLRIKVRSSPAAFSTPLWIPFLSFSLAAGAVLPEASVNSTFVRQPPSSPLQDTTRPVRKMPRREYRLLFAVLYR
jgi:hypothetical protein